jgi:methylase of polypeptide subunit release factors
MIISNPPYISKDQIPHCDRGIFYEPSIALFDHPPLKFYSEIIHRAIQGWLKDEGYLIFECSPFNIDQIKDLFIQQQDHFEHIKIRFDTNELPRVISAKRKRKKNSLI